MKFMREKRWRDRSWWCRVGLHLQECYGGPVIFCTDCGKTWSVTEI